MKTYTLELTAMEMGMLSAVVNIARHAITHGTPADELPRRMAELDPVFSKIKSAASQIYREEHGTVSRP